MWQETRPGWTALALEGVRSAALRPQQSPPGRCCMNPFFLAHEYNTIYAHTHIYTNNDKCRYIIYYNYMKLHYIGLDHITLHYIRLDCITSHYNLSIHIIYIIYIYIFCIRTGMHTAFLHFPIFLNATHCDTSFHHLVIVPLQNGRRPSDACQIDLTELSRNAKVTQRSLQRWMLQRQRGEGSP